MLRQNWDETSVVPETCWPAVSACAQKSVVIWPRLMPARTPPLPKRARIPAATPLVAALFAGAPPDHEVVHLAELRRGHVEAAHLVAAAAGSRESTGVVTHKGRSRPRHRHVVGHAAAARRPVRPSGRRAGTVPAAR